MACYSTSSSRLLSSSSSSSLPPSLSSPPRSPINLIRRPNPKVDIRETFKARKWRAHAVSLELGEYPPMEDDEEEQDYPMSPREDVNKNDHAGDDATKGSSKPSWQEEEMKVALQAQELQQGHDEQRRRWLENAKPPVRKPMIDERGRAYGRGGRKTASARVWIHPGLGHVVVNHQDLVDYFDRTTDRELVLAPLTATATCGKFDVTAMVTGGGLTGQAGAIRHGLARALNHYNPDLYRPPLKRLGYLTRDPRKVERKKIGHIKARKKPQWVKR